MWTYRCKLRKVVDGDTVDVDIDLGFGIWQMNERVRIMGIDTPESRTRNKIEKKFGLAAKARLKSLLGPKPVLQTTISKKGEDMKGKFGRVLGEIFVSPEVVGDHITECINNPDSSIDLSHDGWVSVNDILIEEGHAYDYHGGKKKDFKAEIKEEKEKQEKSVKEI